MSEKNATIICIGTELLMGDTVNTNAAVLARALAELGINVYSQSVVGDNPKRLRAALSEAFSRADIVITTGGLGPTYDDLTKETIADFFGLPLEEDKKSLEWLCSFFKSSGREMTENNKKQAMMPRGCTVFHNQNGTAPGCAIERDGKTAIMLPGPPRECGPMFYTSAVPFLQKYTNTRLVSRHLYFFGIGESALESRLHYLMAHSTNPTVAPYAKEGEVMLRVTASVSQESEAAALLDPVVRQIWDAAGEYIYGQEIGSLENAVVAALSESGLTLAVAESCTGGLLMKRITDIPGASAVFSCGVCAYSCEIKKSVLSVSPETLDSFGAVSRETAAEMARGVRSLSGCDIGVSVTGNAGPQGSEGKPVGLVYIGISCGWHESVRELRMERRDDDVRDYIRMLSASNALDLVLKTLKKR